MGSFDFRRRTGFCRFRMQQRLCNGDKRWSNDTGLVSYHDQQGNAMQINRDDVSQIIER